MPYNGREFHRTISASSDSDASSVGGYETAPELFEAGWDSPISSNGGSVAGNDSTTLTMEAGSNESAAIEDIERERLELKKICHLIHTLNDCIWCTNVFVKARQSKRSTKRTQISWTKLCAERRKNPYPDDDITKELEYIEYMLDTLLKSIIPFVEKMECGSKYDQVKEYFNKTSELLSPDQNNGSTLRIVDRFSEVSERYQKKASEIDSLLQSGGYSCFDETALNVMFRTIVSEAESVGALSPTGREISVERPPENGKKSVRVGPDLSSQTELEAADKLEACTEMLEALQCLLMQNEKDSRKEVNEREVEHLLTIIATNPIEWRRDFSEMCSWINEKTKLGNFFLDIVKRKESRLVDEMRSFTYELDMMREKRKDLGLFRRSGHRVGGLMALLRACNPFPSPCDSLLFEKEKWRAEMVEIYGDDPVEHLGGISLPVDYNSFKNDTRATYYGIKRKNMLSISLQTADMTEKIKKSLKMKIFDLAKLFLSIVLYFSDMVSDLVLAREHYTQGNTMYSYLTLVFVFAPLMGETLSKLILKSLGWDKEYGKLKWKDVFNFNDIKIIRWMASSVNYSLKSMKDYKRLAPSYADLHSYRCSKSKKEFKVVEGTNESVDSTHIHYVFYSMLAWNERFMLQTMLAESLNESAPQLLLQLVIIFKQFVAGDYIGFKSWLCIVTSTLSLSWSMHLSHFNRHYHTGGRVLNNSYNWPARILEFVGNCFVYGSRIFSICTVITFQGLWFVVGAFIYLTVIYSIMVLTSARKEIYKTLHRYKTTIFWPLHRMFTVPYRIGVWRMDSVDHLLFYSEIVFLAVLAPFITPEGLEQKTAWIVTGMILSLASVGVLLLFLFKKCLHPYGYVCENR